MLAPNYYIIAGLSIACLVIGIYHLHQNYSFQREAVKWFECLASIIICNIVIDTLYYTFAGQPYVVKDVLYGLKFIEFSINPFIPLAIIELFRAQHPVRENKRTVDKIYHIAVALCIINMIVLLVDLYIHFIYTIDDNNNYQRGSLIIIPMVILFTCVGLSLKVIQNFSANIQHASRRTIISFCIIVGAGYLIRLIIFETNFDWLCVMIAYYLLLIYTYSMTMKIDPLTRLFNRNVYNHYIERIDFPTIIFMMDANNFKQINDKHGHNCGDETLKALADCILAVFEKTSYCFRIGGDEFCVVMKPDSFKELAAGVANSDVFKIAESYIDQLNDYIKKRSDEHPESVHLKHGLSQGYGVYYPPISSEFDDEKKKKKQLTIDKVVQLADMRMYRQKRAYKAELKKALQPAENNDSH